MRPCSRMVISMESQPYQRIQKAKDEDEQPLRAELAPRPMEVWNLREPRLWAWGTYPQSCASRMTAPSVEGAKGNFASAEATKGLCDRPLETFAPCGGDSWKVAAALSAAVTTSNSQETALTLRRNQAKRKVPRPTPAALRERGVWGERRFSQRSGLSPQNLSLTYAFSVIVRSTR